MKTGERKEQLRRRAAGLPKVDAADLMERFLALPQVAEARTVMVFYGVGREPDTSGLIQTLLERGKQVALPVCLPHRGMEARLIRGEDELVMNRYGIPEPDGMCPLISREKIEVVLVPNVMCDRAGYRLGQGGGYYDRWLTGYSGYTVAICPADRLVDELPREAFDMPVQLVLSDG